ncbi:hypothetical protein [Winogradskyella sediminis]|uniref:Uncharacterized protein n=1 Tax=Winogradskyella sediminis TaxID=1382466 RepID=A0A1H1R3L1_9FLAO|nr:hypothetical protein [Winogradskyella sediminis]SDS30317.1 hypothetical protein SAMN04489797_1307 [Winogradskyella sediminis]
MKQRITFVFVFVLGSFCFAQTLDFKKIDFSTSSFSNEELTAFEFTKIATPLAFEFQQNDSKFSMLEADTDFELNSEVFNSKLLSNLKLYENNYQNDFNYSRGCGPLEDGLTHTVSGSDVMISRFIDYAVNGYLKSLIFND